MPEPGDEAPDFTLPRGGGGHVSLSALRPAPVVLYFYPRDDTPGCTTEAQEFTALGPRFEAAGAVVLGVSADSVASHERFARKRAVGVQLLSDEGGGVARLYGVWVEKKMYGRSFMGLARTTFLIGADGRIAQVWRKVRAPGHAAAVLQILTGLP